MMNRWTHPGNGTRAKTREELERTHRIVGIMKHGDHEIAWTVSRHRKHEDYLSVVGRERSGECEED